MTVPLSLAWVALMLCGAVITRPMPSRIRTLPRVGRDPRPGRRVENPAARRAATAACLALPTMVLSPLAAVFVAAAVWVVPAVRARKSERRRLLRIERDLPEVVDLLLLAVGAGLSVRQATAAVARRSTTLLGSELGRAVAEADRGRRLADALDEVPSRAGDAVRPLVGALAASERYGAPLAPALDRLAAEVRATARRRAEEAARRVPVKLLFPLVLCILPAFALLTVAPLIASALRSLRL